MDLSVENLQTPGLTKAQLTQALFEQLGLNMRESRDMVDAFFELASQGLCSGDDLKITGFGNFQVRAKAARPGRNPRTGAFVPIQARRVVSFSASQRLKEQVQRQGAAHALADAWPRAKKTA